MSAQQSACAGVAWLVWNDCNGSMSGTENQSVFLSMMRIAGGVTAAMKIATPQIYAQIVRISNPPPVPDNMITGGVINPLRPVLSPHVSNNNFIKIL